MLTYHDISIRKLYTVLLKFINTIFFSYIKLYLFVNKCIKKRNKSSSKKQINYVKKLRKYIYIAWFSIRNIINIDRNYYKRRAKEIYIII